MEKAKLWRRWEQILPLEKKGKGAAYANLALGSFQSAH